MHIQANTKKLIYFLEEIAIFSDNIINSFALLPVKETGILRPLTAL